VEDGYFVAERGNGRGIVLERFLKSEESLKDNRQICYLQLQILDLCSPRLTFCPT